MSNQPTADHDQTEYDSFSDAQAELLHYANQSHYSYDEFCDLVSQTGNIYLHLLRAYLNQVPNPTIESYAIAIGHLMVALQENL